MPINPDQMLYIILGLILAATVICWVIIEAIQEQARLRAKVEQARAREETRREVAAYVAEGSMTPEDAATILTAGPDPLDDGIGSTIRECIKASAAASRRFSGSEARSRARAAVQSE